jgi:hypothetical protein
VLQPTLPPPWFVLAAFLGVMHGALFHLILGSHVRQLPTALAVGMAGGVVGGFIGTMIPPAVLAIGETNLIATGVTAWLALVIARLFRFC